jgi:TolB-like protein
MFTDIVGYSALMGTDQHKAFELLKKNRQIQKPIIEKYNGTWLKEIGDGVLASFTTVSDAVFCATAIQNACKNEPVLKLRIGIHQGEVVFENNDVFGDGVNIASRIEPLAPPGAIYVSSAVFHNISNRKEFETSYISEYKLKNIDYPIKVYQVSLQDPKYLSDLVIDSGPTAIGKKRQWVKFATIGMVFISLLVAVWLIVNFNNGSSNNLGDNNATTKTAADKELLALPSGPRIAVLQFKNLSDNPEQDYFTDGLTEDIITALSKTDLFVLGSGTSFRFNIDSMGLGAIGKELDVRYLLTGNVRRQENTIRVTARLVDGTTERQLWGSTYDRDLTTVDIFSLQDDITRRVVGIISDYYGVIARTNMESIERKHPDEFDAYECVLRARKYAHSHTQEDHLIARDCLEKTIEQDSTYVDALAWLAFLYREEYFHDYNQKPHALERALKLARKAVDLDQLNQQAYRSLAVAYFGLKNVDEFFIAAERAIELNPNNPGVIGGLGIQFACAGEWERGINLLENANLLNPYSFQNWRRLHFAKASDYCLKQRYADALVESNQIQFHDLPASDIMIIAILVLVGQEEKAQTKLKEILNQNPDFIQNAREELEKLYLVNQDLIDLFMSNLNRVSGGS